jgi:hypothetical protein
LVRLRPNGSGVPGASSHKNEGKCSRVT